jgi:hypothetical protein
MSKPVNGDPEADKVYKRAIVDSARKYTAELADIDKEHMARNCDKSLGLDIILALNDLVSQIELTLSYAVQRVNTSEKQSANQTCTFQLEESEQLLVGSTRWNRVYQTNDEADAADDTPHYVGFKTQEAAILYSMTSGRWPRDAIKRGLLRVVKVTTNVEPVQLELF